MDELKLIEALFNFYASFINIMYSYLAKNFSNLTCIIQREIDNFNNFYGTMIIVFEGSKIKIIVKKYSENESITFFLNKNQVTLALNKLLDNIYEELKNALGLQDTNKIIDIITAEFSDENLKFVTNIQKTEEINLFSFLPTWVNVKLKKEGLDESVEDFFFD